MIASVGNRSALYFIELKPLCPSIARTAITENYDLNSLTSNTSNSSQIHQTNYYLITTDCAIVGTFHFKTNKHIFFLQFSFYFLFLSTRTNNQHFPITSFFKLIVHLPSPLFLFFLSRLHVLACLFSCLPILRTRS